MSTVAVKQAIRSTVPARLDRLGWSPFHTRMIFGLGAAWILDGLQIAEGKSLESITKPITSTATDQVPDAAAVPGPA